MSDPAILFVCLGNICRSPLAEAAFRREAVAAGLDVTIDSAGTGDWHIGQPPDERAIATAREEGIDISEYRARQVERADFDRFTHIVAMDAQNLADLRKLAPESATALLSLLMDHAPGHEGASIADPYHGEAEQFGKTWRDVVAGAQGLASELRA